MDIITEEAKRIKAYINKTWPYREVVFEVPMRKLFPEPTNSGTKHIWKHGHADIVVYEDSSKKKIVGVIEPGGAHHFTDATQIKNDKRKYILCKLNGVRCLRFANGLLSNLSNRKKRQLLGSCVFPKINSTS